MDAIEERIAKYSVLGKESPLWALNSDPQHTSVALAGSFLLWCQYNADWKYNDIDVWCDHDVFDRAVEILHGLVGGVIERTNRGAKVGEYHVIDLPADYTPFYTCTAFDFPVLNGFYNGRELYLYPYDTSLLSDRKLCEDRLPDTPAMRARVEKYVRRGFKQPEFMDPGEATTLGTWRFNSAYRGYFRTLR